jgi:deazaflavin-dependent oxidoreductase (nitroreductase family)
MQSTRRRLYAGGRPGRLAGLMNRAQARAASLGLPPKRVVTLEVRGRTSGRIFALPLVVAEYEGERYLVSMLGERAGWVRNARAAGGRAVLRHGRREEVTLEEVPADRRAPILRRYLQLAPGARPHFPVDRREPLEAFERIAAGYPVFRVT